MKVTKDVCPSCENAESEKIVLHKDVVVANIYKCEVCGFRWAVAKDGK